MAGPGAILREDYLRGAARVASGGTFVWNAGVVASVLKTGTGVYQFTLDPGASVEEHTVTTQRIGSDTDRVGLNVDPVSTTEIIVRASSASDGGAIDTDFFIFIRRMRTAQ